MKAFHSTHSHGFLATALHRPQEPHPLRYFTQKTSFWIATLSMFAFVIGNMMGQHGWHAFWASVLGNSDDSLIVYTGTVSPIAQIPDYQKWSTYGGVPEAHTFRQVPKDVLKDLPAYNPADLIGKDNTRGVYSVGYMGSYETGEERSGSHPGIDIRVPEGTPIRAVANGVVIAVKDGGGFGKVIVVRHPNVPDPADPTQTTTLYSSYAHLSAMFVAEGMMVSKGEEIGLSGQTGDASGPHLHFQMDRDEAPWHPYWPFSDSEARSSGMNLSQAVDAGLHSERGYQFTVNAMLYVQANHKPVTQTVARSERTPTREETIQSRRDARLQERIRRQNSSRVLEALKLTAPQAPITTPSVVVNQVVAAHSESQTVATKPEHVSRVEFSHDGSFSGREWEKLRIRLLDEQGALVADPQFSGTLVMRTAYGDAEFDPPILKASDFTQGEAKILVLPRGQRTVVYELKPFTSLSTPMRYER